MPAGPLNINVGQSSNVTVLGFDQNGQPMPIDFTATPASYVIDNPAFDSVTPNADGSAVLQSLAEGTANLTVTVAGLTDTAQVINAGGAATPVLTSVKLDFSPPA